MTANELGELVRSLQGLPVAAILTELRTNTFVALNDAATEMIGTPAADLVGTDVLPHIDPADRDAARSAQAAMVDRVIDGYQVQRRIITAEGTRKTVSICGRRVTAQNNLYGLWILVSPSDALPVVETLMMGASAVVLAFTDHDWQIEYMSADADLLGASGSELRGFPLLGLVHPSAASAFLAAASQAATDRHAVTVLSRMRDRSARWADRYCLMVPICEHQPPRLGVVITAGPPPPATTRSSHPLDEHVRQAVVETRAVETLEAVTALAGLPAGSELSARQTEIVARLIAGQSAADIARSMFLSPSTIRNHLHAIYRKFGVHSQAQLLAALLRGRSSHHG